MIGLHFVVDSFTLESLPEYWPVILFTFCVMVAVGVLFSKKFIHTEIRESVKQSFETCSSPDCFRCSGMKELINVAHNRFLQYSRRKQTVIHSDQNSGLDRIRTSFCETLMNSYGNEVQGVGNAGDVSKKPSEPDTQKERFVFNLLNLTSRPYWENVYRADLEKLEKNYAVIKEEFEGVLCSTEPVGDWASNSTPTGNWDIFSLVNQGCIVPQNAVLCPQTWALIQSMECVMADCVFGNALFSVIYPGTVITEHCGPTNTRLRCHFALSSPKGCRLIVNGISQTWKEGECLLFDDSYPHSVDYTITPKGDNSTCGKTSPVFNTVGDDGQACPKACRVVLMLDLWHPGLREKERDALSYAFSTLGTCVVE